MSEWRNVSQDPPDEFVTVFFVDPEAGVTIGYYSDTQWEDSEGNLIRSTVSLWMPITYPKAPEGSVDTDWE